MPIFSEKKLWSFEPDFIIGKRRYHYKLINPLITIHVHNHEEVTGLSCWEQLAINYYMAQYIHSNSRVKFKPIS